MQPTHLFSDAILDKSGTLLNHAKRYLEAWVCIGLIHETHWPIFQLVGLISYDKVNKDLQGISH